jgi:hypothetical protein
MGKGAITQDISPGQIGLDEGNFLNRYGSLIFLIERSTKSFQPGNNSLPRILR